MGAAPLAVEKFIDPRTRGIGEHFKQAWNRAPGKKARFRDPVYHFQWE